LRYGFAGQISFVCNATRSIQLRSYPGQGGRCNMSNYARGTGAPGSGAGGGLNLAGACAFSDLQCSCQKWSGGNMKPHAYAVGPQSFGGFSVAQAGFASGGGCQTLCGMNNPSPGGGGAGTGMGYPNSNKGGTGGPGLVMIWF
jgi:hypothetical protein